MRYMVIGLGNFGLSLANQLLELGHEVIGIDCKEHIVESVKDSLTGAVTLNAVDELAMKSQPLREMDAVVVAIGEDWAASIQTVALLKKLQVKRIIGRSLSPLHETVLQGLGIKEVINPENEAAMQIATKLVTDRARRTYHMTDDVAIYEVEVPNKFMGKTVFDLNLSEDFDLELVCVKRRVIKKSLIGQNEETYVAKYHFDTPHKFDIGDIMVIIGHPEDFNHFKDGFL